MQIDFDLALHILVQLTRPLSRFSSGFSCFVFSFFVIVNGRAICLGKLIIKLAAGQNAFRFCRCTEIARQFVMGNGITCNTTTATTCNNNSCSSCTCGTAVNENVITPSNAARGSSSGNSSSSCHNKWQAPQTPRRCRSVPLTLCGSHHQH